MSRELLILRHGLAEPPHGKADAERELSDRGREDVQRIGRWMRARDCLPDATIASPATRAQVTAREALAASGTSADSLSLEPAIYDASRATLIEIVERYETEPGRVLLVGHNPGLESLVHYLTGDRVGLASGVLARLTMPAHWRDLEGGRAILVELVDPSQLVDG